MQKFVLCISVLCVCAAAQVSRRSTHNPRTGGLAADITIRRLNLNNASTLSPADRQKIIADIKNRKYEHSGLEEISERVRRAYQERGYFKAEVDSSPAIDSIRQTATGQVIDATVTVIQEGQQYRMQDISFTGAKAFPANELRKQFLINKGDIFATDKIHEGLENLRRLYGAAGYADFTPIPDTKIDDNAGTISLSIDIAEGELFHYGELTVSGEGSEPGAREELLKAWRTYQGRRYDGGAALKDFLREIHARRDVNPEEVFETSHDASSHVVNIHLSLLNPPPQEFVKKQTPSNCGNSISPGKISTQCRF